MCLVINVSIPRHCIPADDVLQPSNFFPRVKMLCTLRAPPLLVGDPGTTSTPSRALSVALDGGVDMTQQHHVVAAILTTILYTAVTAVTAVTAPTIFDI